MITYLVIGILLILLVISVPIIAIILFKKYNFRGEAEATLFVVLSIFLMGLFLIFGINCIIRSTLLF